MPRIVHFEILCDDTDRASKFYTDVFDWNIQKWDGPIEYRLVMTGDTSKPGIDGGMMKRDNPGAQVYNIIDVPSCDEYLEKIKQHGGEIVVPKQAVPGVGWSAYFKDTEGNVLGIIQMDENAK